VKILRFLSSYSKATLVLAVVTGIVSGASSTGLLALINSALSGTAYPSRGVLWGFAGLCVLVPLARVVSELTVT
jgi:putative ATP-binding cassette transporter